MAHCRARNKVWLSSMTFTWCEHTDNERNTGSKWTV